MFAIPTYFKFHNFVDRKRNDGKNLPDSQNNYSVCISYRKTAYLPSGRIPSGFCSADNFGYCWICPLVVGVDTLLQSYLIEKIARIPAASENVVLRSDKTAPNNTILLRRSIKLTVRDLLR